jgi:hypothetical protein
MGVEYLCCTLLLVLHLSDYTLLVLFNFTLCRIINAISLNYTLLLVLHRRYTVLFVLIL